MIKLLRDHTHYEVGLEKKLPNLELEIKSTVQAGIRGAPLYEEGTHVPGWGPRYVFFFDEVSVLSFFLEFEERWDAIPPQNRNKEDVIAFLEALLCKGKRLT